MKLSELLNELNSIYHTQGDMFVSAKDGGGLKWAVRGVEFGSNSMNDPTVYLTHSFQEENNGINLKEPNAEELLQNKPKIQPNK